MNFFYALVNPILILGLIYILIIENKGIPLWIERIADNSIAIWTFGVITITVLYIEICKWKMISEQQFGNLMLGDSIEYQ